MNWISNHMSKIKDAKIFRLMLKSNSDLTLVSNFYAQRIAYTRFHLETGYKKYPINPVNPVYFKV